MTAENNKENDEHGEGREPGLFFETARKVLLAGIGAMSLAQDEVVDFIDRLVKQGEIAEKDGRTLIHEVRDKRKKHAEKMDLELRKRVESVLERMNIPTKADIDLLSEKIANLSKKIDELKKPWPIYDNHKTVSEP